MILLLNDTIPPTKQQIILPSVPRIVPATRIPRRQRSAYEEWIELERWQMAISVSAIASGGTTTDTDVYTTGACIPANGMVFIAALNSKATTPDTAVVTFSGTGLGIPTSVRSRVFNTTTKRLQVWRTVAAGASSGIFAATYPANQTGGIIQVIQVTGCKTSGVQGADSVVQDAVNFSDTNVTTLAVTLVGFADAVNNVGLAFFGHSADQNSTVGSGFTALTNYPGHNTPAMTLLSEYKVGQDLAPSASWATLSTCGGIAVEIAMATGGGMMRHLNKSGLGETF